MASSRDLMSQMRHGAIIFISGAKALMVSSKRTWSLPLPVQPWQMAEQPSFLAISTSRLAIIGRAKLVPSRYFFSYTAPIFSVGQI